MKNTVVTFQEAKDKGEKLSMLTAYDYSTARLIDEAGVNAILVGDSLGMVVLGYEDTLSVTMEDMIHHSAAVARGIKDTLLITDMPFMSYQTSVYDAVVNAGRLMKEGRAQAVKLEGGKEVCPQIKAIVDASIPVCAHLGLTPQSVNAFGGFKVQGKGEAAAQKLLDKFRFHVGIHGKHILIDKYLSVASGTGTDSDGRDMNALGNLCGKGLRHTF